MNKCYNLVFEGGGVKGIGLVGAVDALTSANCCFYGLAGTSAGAIVASLMAAGFTASEMKEIVMETNYLKFKSKGLLDHFGVIGKALSIFLNYGIYSSEYFENWLRDILAAKNVHTFGDIKNPKSSNLVQKYRFQAIASDITAKQFLVLPDDLHRFGIDPDDFSVAKAVRMSMSIPIFFEPAKLKDRFGKEHYIVDGGLLSNYPLWLFEKAPSHQKTIGVRFSPKPHELKRVYEVLPISCMVDYIKSIINTMMEAHDKQHIHESNGDFNRTIFVSPSIIINDQQKNIDATYFEISKKESELLFKNGQNAGNKFLRLQKSLI